MLQNDLDKFGPDRTSCTWSDTIYTKVNNEKAEL